MIGEGLILLKLLFLECSFSCLRVQVPVVRQTWDLGYHLSISVSFPSLQCRSVPLFACQPFLPRGNTRQQARKDGTALHWQGFIRRRMTEDRNGGKVSSHRKRDHQQRDQFHCFHLSRLPFGIGTIVPCDQRHSSARMCERIFIRSWTNREFFYRVLPLFFSSRERNARTLRSSVSYPRSTGAFLPDDDVREDKATAGSWTPGRDSRTLKYNVFHPPVPHFSGHALRNFARVFQIYMGCRITDDTRIERKKKRKNTWREEVRERSKILNIKLLIIWYGSYRINYYH